MTTPAPSKLSTGNINYVKKLIQANPADSKLQNVISQYKDKFPSDFKGVGPIPLNQLSPVEQVKRNQFIRVARSQNIPDSITTGKTIIPANPCQDTTLDEMEAQLNNFFDKITGPASAALYMPTEIKAASSIMSHTMTKFSNKMVGSLNDKLEGEIQSKFESIAAATFAMVSPAYPYPKALEDVTKFQEGMIPGVSSLLDGVYCSAAKITDALAGTISDLLSAAVKNVTNVPACAVQQVMGAINNKIVNTLDEVTGPLLSPVADGLGMAFNVKHFLNGVINFLQKVQSFADCGDKTDCP